MIHEFERTPVYADEFFNAVLRPDDGIIEGRASAARAQCLERTWMKDFADRFDRVPVPVGITPADFRELKAKLDAKLATGNRPSS